MQLLSLIMNVAEAVDPADTKQGESKKAAR